jgi:hypothetical protein
MKINIPSSLSEITLEQYIKYNRVLNLKDIDEDAILMAIVSIFCDIPLNETIKFPIKDLKDITEHIDRLFKGKANFTPIYKNYGFIPNFDKITMSEQIDLEGYINDNENLHRAMAILYRPITHKINGNYTIEKYKGTDEHCKDMLSFPVELFLGALVFFWNLNSDLMTATNHYLLKQITEAEVSGVPFLLDGDGIQALTQSLKDAELQSRMLAS